MSNERWADNEVQFARLICEICATSDIDLASLCTSMDLGPERVQELFDRANDVWEKAKGKTSYMCGCGWKGELEKSRQPVTTCPDCDCVTAVRKNP